ncbi:MAG: class I SAM-dependent methyltransferase [Acidobacteria bacterium]|nr:class I SAM-dependent methyltransferase [Acidobacteriota bacterium]
MIRRVEGLEKTPAFQQESELVLACLQLKPGDVVADIGAGTGLFARPLARAVGPMGRVLAVDIDPELLRYIERRAREEKIPNIETILGAFDDPLLPRNRVDLAFIHDVLHHIERREAYLQTLSRLLKPRARIALIELNRDDPENPHRNEPAMLVGKEQAVQWMSAAGFRPVAQCTIYQFEEKWFLIFERK